MADYGDKASLRGLLDFAKDVMEDQDPASQIAERFQGRQPGDRTMKKVKNTAIVARLREIEEDKKACLDFLESGESFDSDAARRTFQKMSDSNG